MCVSGVKFEPTGDIVRDICNRFRQLDCEIQAALAERVEKEARAAYGKESLYIRSGERMEMRDVVPDEPLSEQARRLGLSKSTVWRHLKRQQRIREREQAEAATDASQSATNAS